MPKYRVLLRGENLLIEMDGDPQLLGFYTNRNVRAADEDDAEMAAVALIRADSDLLDAMIDSDDPPEPKVYAEQISRIAWWKRLGGRGYRFFPMEEQEDDADT